jgi:CubicO group peptidase (beta-lactamase class C family)
MHKPVPDILSDLVFGPMGMKATTLRKDPWRLLDGKKAWPYLITDGRPSLFMHPEEAFGAGGVFSTVEDLARWEQNFNSPKYEPNIISEMQRVLPLRDGTCK